MSLNFEPFQKMDEIGVQLARLYENCVKTPWVLGASGLHLSERQIPQVVGFIRSG